MSCPTCDHTMQRIENETFWCPRCGTLRLGPMIEMPMLVERVRMFAGTLGRSWSALAHRLGILESIGTPHRQEARQ